MNPGSLARADSGRVRPMRWNRQLSSLGPLLVVTLVGVACGGASTPPPEPAASPAATDAAPDAPVAATAEAPADAPVDATAEPALEDSTDAPTTGDSDATGTASGGSALSDGETRTMKVIQQTVLENRARFRTCYDAVQTK